MSTRYSSVQHLAVDLDAALEVGVVAHGDLDEDDVAGVGQVVVVDDLADLLAVLLDVAGAGLVGDEPDRAAGAVAQEGLGAGVVDDLGGAQLEARAPPGTAATPARWRR